MHAPVTLLQTLDVVDDGAVAVVVLKIHRVNYIVIVGRPIHDLVVEQRPLLVHLGHQPFHVAGDSLRLDSMSHEVALEQGLVPLGGHDLALPAHGGHVPEVELELVVSVKLHKLRGLIHTQLLSLVQPLPIIQ